MVRNSANNFTDIYYKRNFLQQVIVRIDFESSFEELKASISDKLFEKVLSRFPLPEKKEIAYTEFKIEKKEITTKEPAVFYQWIFYGNDRQKQLLISHDFFYIIYNKYNNFEELKEDFHEITSSLFEIYDIKSKRFGLRYINNIEIQEKNPFSWKPYLHKNLLTLFNVSKNKIDIIRAINSIEYKYNDFNVRFQYGMNNPDYPARIKKKSFILDFDTYYQGLLELENLTGYLDQFHMAIQESFEESVTDKLRDLLNEQ